MPPRGPVPASSRFIDDDSLDGIIGAGLQAIATPKYTEPPMARLLSSALSRVGQKRKTEGKPSTFKEVVEEQVPGGETDISSLTGIIAAGLRTSGKFPGQSPILSELLARPIEKSKTPGGLIEEAAQFAPIAPIDIVASVPRRLLQAGIAGGMVAGGLKEMGEASRFRKALKAEKAVEPAENLTAAIRRTAELPQPNLEHAHLIEEAEKQGIGPADVFPERSEPGFRFTGPAGPEPPEPRLPTEPPSGPPPSLLEPEKGPFLGTLGMNIRPATEALRSIDQLPAVPKGIGADLASKFEEAARGEVMFKNVRDAELAEPAKKFMALPHLVAKQAAHAMQNAVWDDAAKQFVPMTTGSPIVDEQVVRPILARRAKDYTEAIAAGVEIPGITPTPRINPDVGKIVRLLDTNEPKARMEIVRLYRQHGESVPDPERLGRIIDQIRDEEHAFAVTGVPAAPNVRMSRAVGIPGSMGDATSKRFSKREFIEAQNIYGRQWASAVSHAQQFGGKGEVITDAMEALRNNPTALDLLRAHNDNYLGSMPGRVASRFSNALADWRALKASSALGKAFIPNAAQTLVTTFPRAAQTTGFGAAVADITAGVAEIARSPAARQWAADIGAVSDDVTRELATLAGGAPRARFPQKAAGFTLAVTPFSKEERINNLVAAAVGRRHLRRLYEMIDGGGHRAFLAESELRKTMKSRPDLVDDLVESAHLGKPFEEAGEATGHYAYNFARETQFRANPNDLPIFASTDLGKSFMHFKNFTYNYTRFLKNQVLDPALRKGAARDTAPLRAWLASQPIAGSWTRIGRGILNGEIQSPEELGGFLDEQIEDPAGSYAADFAANSGLGILTSYADAVIRGTSGSPAGTAQVASEFFGPEFGAIPGVALRGGTQPGGFPVAIAREVVPNPFGVTGSALNYAFPRSTGRVPASASVFGEEASELDRIIAGGQ